MPAWSESGGTPSAGRTLSGGGRRVPPRARSAGLKFPVRLARVRPPPVRMSIAFGFGTLAWLALTGPAPLSAQNLPSWMADHRGPIVTGTVVDVRTREPVSNAVVRLVNAADSSVLGAGWTDQAGRYAIPLFLDEGEDPGELVVEAGSLGYTLATSQAFRLRPGRMTAVAQISLRPEPVVLDPLIVTPERRSWTQLPPPRELVRRRQLEGRGIFIPGAMVENAGARSIPEFIAERVDGIEVEFPRGGPELQSTFYPRCVTVLVNEWPPMIGFSLGVIRARDVGALEVYRTWFDVPDNLQNRIIQLGREPRCTVVNVWLWNAWNIGVDPNPGT